jgi:transcriptional antiterminator NusG
MTTEPQNDPQATPSDTSQETPVEVAAPVDESPAQTPAPETPAATEAPTETPEEPVDEGHTRAGMNWFALRVASNKENYVRDTLLRKVEIEGMTHLIGRILVPTEKTKTVKGGKSRITEVKQYPGYVFVEMRLEEDGRIPQDIFFLVKETTGVGDFVGATGRPTPLANHEIVEIHNACKAPDETPTIRMTFESGELVNITEGPFEGYEGTVDELVPEKGKVRVLVTIFGRQAPVEIEEWMLAKANEE